MANLKDIINNGAVKGLRSLSNGLRDKAKGHLKDAKETMSSMLSNDNSTDNGSDNVQDQTTQQINQALDKAKNNPITNKLKQKAGDAIKNKLSETSAKAAKDAVGKQAKQATKEATKKTAELAKEAVKKAAQATANAVKETLRALGKVIASVASYIASMLAALAAFIAANIVWIILIIAAIALIVLLIVFIHWLLYDNVADEQHYSGLTSLNDTDKVKINDMWAGMYYEKYSRESLYAWASLPDELEDPYMGKTFDEVLEWNEMGLSSADYDRLYQVGTSYTNQSLIEDIDKLEDQFKLNAGFISVLDQNMNKNYAYPAQFIRPIYSSCTKDYMENGNEDAFKGTATVQVNSGSNSGSNTSSTSTTAFTKKDVDIISGQASDASKYQNFPATNGSGRSNQRDTLITSGVLNENTYADLSKLAEDKYFLWERAEHYLQYFDGSNVRGTVELINSNAYLGGYNVIVNNDPSKAEKTIANKIYKFADDSRPANLVDTDRCGLAIDTHTPNGCVQVNSNAWEAFKKMRDAAALDGFDISHVASGYRSAAYQNTTYNGTACSRDDTVCSRPYHSDHQTGYVLDIVGANTSLNDHSPRMEWIANHAHEYGFIVRYPEHKTAITQYGWESWHIKYVGTGIASIIKDNDITYDEYYTYYEASDKSPLGDGLSSVTGNTGGSSSSSAASQTTTKKVPLNGCTLLTNLEEARSTAYSNIDENGDELQFYYKLGANDLMESQADYGLGSIVHYSTMYIPSRITGYSLRNITYLDTEWDGSESTSPVKRDVPWMSLDSAKKEELLKMYGPEAEDKLSNNGGWSLINIGAKNTGLYEVGSEITWKNHHAALEAVGAIKDNGKDKDESVKDLYNRNNWKYWADWKTDDTFGEPGVSTGIPATEIAHVIDRAITPFGAVDISYKQEWVNMGPSYHIETFWMINDFAGDQYEIENIKEDISGKYGGNNSDVFVLKRLYHKDDNDWWKVLLNAGKVDGRYYLAGSEKPEFVVELSEEQPWMSRYELIQRHYNGKVEHDGKACYYDYQFANNGNNGYYKCEDIDDSILVAPTVYKVNWHWDFNVGAKRNGNQLEKDGGEFANKHSDKMSGSIEISNPSEFEKVKEQLIKDHDGDDKEHQDWRASITIIVKGTARAEGTLQTQVVYHDESTIESDSDDATEYIKNYLDNYETYIPTMSDTSSLHWKCVTIDRYLNINGNNMQGPNGNYLSNNSFGINGYGNREYTTKPDGTPISGPKDCDEYYKYDSSSGEEIGWVALLDGVNTGTVSMGIMGSPAVSSSYINNTSSAGRENAINLIKEAGKRDSANFLDDPQVESGYISVDEENSKSAYLHYTIDTSPDVIDIVNAPSAHTAFLGLITQYGQLSGTNLQAIQVYADDLIKTIGQADDQVMNDLLTYSQMFTKWGQIYGVDPMVLKLIAAREQSICHDDEHCDLMHSLGESEYKAINYLLTDSTYAIEGNESEYTTFLSNLEMIGEILNGNNDGEGTKFVIDEKGIEKFIPEDDSVNTSIRAAAMKFQNIAQKYNGNVLMAITDYLIGEHAVTGSINTYSASTAREYDQIVNDIEDIGWMHYILNHAGPSDQDVVYKMLTYLNTDLFAYIQPEAGKISQNVKKIFTLRGIKDNAIIDDVQLGNMSGKDMSNSTAVRNAWKRIVNAKDGDMNSANYQAKKNSAERYVDTAWDIITMGRENLVRGENVFDGKLNVYAINPSLAYKQETNWDENTIESIIQTAYAFDSTTYYSDLDLSSKEFWQQNLNSVIGQSASSQFKSGLTTKQVFGKNVNMQYPLEYDKFEHVHHFGANDIYGDMKYRDIYTDWEIAAKEDTDVLPVLSGEVIRVGEMLDTKQPNNKLIELSIPVSAGGYYTDIVIKYEGLDSVSVSEGDKVEYNSFDQDKGKDILGKIKSGQSLKLTLFVDGELGDIEDLIVRNTNEIKALRAMISGRRHTQGLSPVEAYKLIVSEMLAQYGSDSLYNSVVSGNHFNNKNGGSDPANYDYKNYAGGGGIHTGMDFGAGIGKGGLITSPVSGWVIGSYDGCDNESSWGCGASETTIGLAGNQVIMISVVPIQGVDSYVGILYGHLQKEDMIHQGNYVNAGEAIGRMGNSGNSYGHHVHIEVFYLGPVDVSIDELFQSENYGIGFNTGWNSSAVYCDANGGVGPCRLNPYLFMHGMY